MMTSEEWERAGRHDPYYRVLSPMWLVFRKRSREKYMKAPPENTRQHHRRTKDPERREGGQTGSGVKKNPDRLLYPNLPSPGAEHDPMNVLIKTVKRPDMSELTVDLRDVDTIMGLPEEFGDDFPMNEYIKVELWVDAKCLFMEVLGQTDLLDDMPGFGPEYFTKRHQYRTKTVYGRQEYAPWYRQRSPEGIPNLGQFVITHRYDEERDPTAAAAPSNDDVAADGGAGTAANGEAADGVVRAAVATRRRRRRRVDRTRYVVSFCPTVLTGAVLMGVSPACPYIDEAAVRLANGKVHGRLRITPGVYTFGCFWASGLKIGSDAYKHLLGQKGLDSPNCRVDQWEVPAAQQPQQQQLPAGPQAEQEQQPEQPEEEEEDEVRRIRGGGPMCVEDLYDHVKFHDGDAPLMPGEEDDDDDMDVVLVGVTNQCNKPLPVVKVEPNAKRAEAAEKKRKTEEEAAGSLSKLKSRSVASCSSKPKPSCRLCGRSFSHIDSLRYHLDNLICEKKKAKEAELVKWAAHFEEEEKRKREEAAAERKRKMEMDAAERKRKMEMDAAERKRKMEMEAAERRRKMEMDAAEKNCTVEELVEAARKKMIEDAKKKRQQQIEAASKTLWRA